MTMPPARLVWRNEELYELEKLMELHPNMSAKEATRYLATLGVVRTSVAVRRKLTEFRLGRIKLPKGYEAYKAQQKGAVPVAATEPTTFSLPEPSPPAAPAPAVRQSLVERLEEMLVSETEGRLDSPMRLEPMRIEVDPDKVTRVWVTSDWHAPNHHIRRTAAFLHGLEANKPEILILNGDMVEATAFATFKGADHAKPPGLADVPVMRQLLAEVRRAAGPACRIYYRPGNHEDRVIRDHMHAMKDLPMFGWQYWLGLEDHDIEWVNYDQHIKIGNIIVTHGHYALKWSANTVKKHVIEDGFHNVIIGHIHRVGVFYKTFHDKIVWGMEGGGLFDERKMAGYMKGVEDWQPGFTTTTLFGGESFPHPVPMQWSGNYALNGVLYTAEGKK